MPQATKLPGTSGFFRKSRFSGKSSAPGSEAAWDKWLVQKKVRFLRKKFCPRQRSCPGQVACSKKVEFLRKSSAPGSAAAPDKWLVQKKVRFLRKNLPQAAKLPGTSGLFKRKVCFLRKALPQAAKLPGTSGSFLRFPTLCSAHRSPRIPESSFF